MQVQQMANHPCRLRGAFRRNERIVKAPWLVGNRDRFDRMLKALKPDDGFGMLTFKQCTKAGLAEDGENTIRYSWFTRDEFDTDRLVSNVIGQDVSTLVREAEQ
ncbi:MAG: hypothetical protein EOP94_04350 [Zymomonas sp.]|nr:MAG: hypothetical protein EOP94_04350 [Zymomonas sp.]